MFWNFSGNVDCWWYRAVSFRLCSKPLHFATFYKQLLTDYLLPKNYKHKVKVQKSWANQFRTKKMQITCWWNCALTYPDSICTEEGEEPFKIYLRKIKEFFRHNLSSQCQGREKRNLVGKVKGKGYFTVVLPKNSHHEAIQHGQVLCNQLMFSDRRRSNNWFTF